MIPQIESRIEERLLEQFCRTIHSESERKEVIQSYKTRRHNLSQLPEDSDLVSTVIDPPPFKREDSEYAEIILDTNGDGLKYHSFADVGKFTIFPENQWRRMFRRHSYGDMEKNEIS